ncbi:MAG: hypothetical protein KGL63_01020 [Betaproteobacteria bacterium]|nr:hypothetical protein [Betaproteobacteria bacterium]
MLDSLTSSEGHRESLNFENHVVAYLDILGFSNFVQKAENDENIRNKLRNLLYYVIPKHVTPDEIEEKIPIKELNLECVSFSDSIVISAPVESKISNRYPALIAVSIKSIQIAHELLAMGFLVRGAVSVGKLHRTPSSIVGTAYQEAVRCEQSESYPKLLLTDSAKSHLYELLRCNMTRFSIFSQDETEMVILNSIYPSEHYYANGSEDLKSRYLSYKKVILKNINDTALDDKAKEKWSWFAKLFDSNLKYFSELNGLEPLENEIPRITPNLLNPTERASVWMEQFKQPSIPVRIKNGDRS